MKADSLLTMAVIAAVVLTFGGESFARGGNGGRGGSSGQGVHYGTASQGTAIQVRPEGSQRRDGTFLKSGTTASGATVRPGKGRGVMNGAGINVPVQPTAPAAQ